MEKEHDSITESWKTYNDTSSREQFREIDGERIGWGKEWKKIAYVHRYEETLEFEWIGIWTVIEIRLKILNWEVE